MPNMKPILLAIIAFNLAAGMPAGAATVSVIYTFKGGTDGAAPEASMIKLGGTLYGTTYQGGAYGEGTVFSITPDGNETVLHSFGNGNDGANPTSALLALDGTLYGTTAGGGAQGAGTVFSIKPSGKEAVIYAFRNNNVDGYGPYGGLVALSGTLYGTTFAGGSNDTGTVFAVTTAGNETILHDFGNSYGNDGQSPVASMTVSDGILYGTTTYGGANGDGTVFSITASGNETALYSFGQYPDAQFPSAGVRKQGKVFYGTTAFGGNDGEGAVYRLTTDGKNHVVYSFASGNDGANPDSDLTKLGKTFYGVTSEGGDNCQPDANCNGTVYQLTLPNTETVLHAFSGGADGANPIGALTNIDGVLYGTTSAGGTNGAGTVFKVIP